MKLKTYARCVRRMCALHSRRCLRSMVPQHHHHCTPFPSDCSLERNSLKDPLLSRALSSSSASSARQEVTAWGVSNYPSAAIMLIPRAPGGSNAIHPSLLQRASSRIAIVKRIMQFLHGSKGGRSRAGCAGGGCTRLKGEIHCNRK